MSDTMDDAKTPTSDTFAKASLAAQKPLPAPPLSDAHQNADSGSDKSSQPRQDNPDDADDTNMADSDGEAETGPADDGGAQSDAESVNADGTKASKKKKTQRFYCTDYFPCNLSFTRSEHLARHIRKHTGERPFQCHCSRRFSRLDNLRQHAQTVHLNEEIPVDSLAATGARFQRQMRTDRGRTPGGRARSSTAGSLGAPMRGHSKSLSTSSIATVSSVASSVYPTHDDLRRRPAPLVMADPRSRLPLEGPYRAAPDGYRPLTPTEYATPTSATFSNGPGSPRWGGNVVSPPPSHSRPHSMYVTGSRTPSRRLSVPSAESSIFQSPSGAANGRTLFPHGPVSAANSGVFSSPDGNADPASPESSVASVWSRRESTSSTDEAWRRRTWHPGSREFGGPRNGVPTASASANSISSPSGGSSLSHYQAGPEPPLPIADPAKQTNMQVRLPGIESFDPLHRARPITPPRRGASPMAIDMEGPPPTSGPPTSILRSTLEYAPDSRRPPSGQWDMSLHRGLTRLDIASERTPRDAAGAWASEANRAVQAQAEQTLRSQHQPTVRFESDVRLAPTHYSDAPPGLYSRGHHQTASAPSFNAATSRHLKRQGWYNGPSMPSSTGGEHHATARVDRMVHPNLANGFSGFPGRVPQTVHEHQPQHAHAHPAQEEQQPYAVQQRGQPEGDLRRLAALVAVATSEVQASTKAY